MLTVNEENRLKTKVIELIQRQDEISILKLEHKKQMDEMNVKFDRILALIQENPKLASIKKETLNKF